MKQEFYIKSWCRIKNDTISKYGNDLFRVNSQEFSDFSKAAYKHLEISYPKFFKMDNLSKLAFLAADVILKNEDLGEEENNIALVFSNKASSLDTDRKHHNSIQNAGEYFPSPAVFVYTLPNICLGEISIRHRLYSENSFFIFERFNAEHLHSYANSLLRSGKAESLLCGWVDYDENEYEAFLYLVDSEGEIPHTNKQLTELYNTK